MKFTVKASTVVLSLLLIFFAVTIVNHFIANTVEGVTNKDDCEEELDETDGEKIIRLETEIMEKQKEVDELRIKVEQPLEPNNEDVDEDNVNEDTEAEENVDKLDTENEE
jgi:hypothetical protein